jgi:hypothetical protein
MRKNAHARRRGRVSHDPFTRFPGPLPDTWILRDDRRAGFHHGQSVGRGTAAVTARSLRRLRLEARRRRLLCPDPGQRDTRHLHFRRHYGKALLPAEWPSSAASPRRNPNAAVTKALAAALALAVVECRLRGEPGVAAPGAIGLPRGLLPGAPTDPGMHDSRTRLFDHGFTARGRGGERMRGRGSG